MSRFKIFFLKLLESGYDHGLIMTWRKYEVQITSSFIILFKAHVVGRLFHGIEHLCYFRGFLKKSVNQLSQIIIQTILTFTFVYQIVRGLSLQSVF